MDTNTESSTSKAPATNGSTAADTTVGFRPQAAMKVEPPKPEDLQKSYASIVGDDSNPKGWYGGMMNTLGACIGTMGAVPCCIVCPNPYKEVHQGNVGLVTKFGKFYKAVDPGLVKINPLSEKLIQVDVKIQIVEVPKQVCMTKDNVTLHLTSVIYYHIVSPHKAAFGIANVRQALIERTQTTLRRDPQLARTFADIAREEYVSVGIRQALHPQVDLSTEPRWGRTSGTMGEDANLTSSLLVEYIKGFQGEKIGRHSVITTTKHFPGGGPMENGEDSHFPWGKNQTYPGNNQEYHLIPFKAAIAAGTRQMMPYYSRPINTSWEEVAFGFNKGVVTDLLKNQLGFDGIVVTDWGIVTDRAWGLEDKTELERARRVLEAGCDIFGGETKPELIIELVKKGLVAESRIDESVRKLMKEKFELGLFDHPFVDPEHAANVAGNDYFSRLGNETQRRAFTLLTNKDEFLPLPISALEAKFYIEGMEAEALESRNLTVVDKPEEADYALLRLDSPFKPSTGDFLAQMINNGSIEYNTTEKARQAKIYATLPTIVDIRLNRPAAVPEIAESAAALFGSYGSSHDAFLDVVLGVDGWGPEGQLPFDLPRSMAAAEASFEDVPFDTVDPLFKFGHGLRYAESCKANP